MYLAVPMVIRSRDGFRAQCEAKGIGRTVSLILPQHEDIKAGDHVMVMSAMPSRR
jgi:hydrogenase expression/formation protein HypC